MHSEPWQVAAARFCVERVEFSVKELENFLEKPPYNIPHEHARSFFEENIQAPNGRSLSRNFRKSEEGQGGLWTAPAELVSMITDYDELREARKNAYSAWWISMAALGVSALGALFQFLSLK